MLPLRIRMTQNFPTNTGCLCLDVHTWHLHISKYRYCVDIGDISSFTQCSSKQRGFKIANLKVCYGILEKINLRLFPFISHCLWAFEKSKWKLKVRRFFIRINTFYEMWWMHPHMFSVWRRKCRQRRNAIVNIRMHIKRIYLRWNLAPSFCYVFVYVWLDCRLLLWT